MDAIYDVDNAFERNNDRSNILFRDGEWSKSLPDISMIFVTFLKEHNIL